MVISNVDMIEYVGGGSCRCMLVENWSTINMFNLKQNNRKDSLKSDEKYNLMKKLNFFRISSKDIESDDSDDACSLSSCDDSS